MKKIITFIKLLRTPRKLVLPFGAHGFLNWMPDKLYLKLIFRGATGRPLDLKDPKTYNEKMQWLKLYYRNPLQTTLVDKCEAKKYIAKLVGEEYIIPTFDSWSDFNDIDFSKLPKQFVLKTTHDQGGVVVCSDKKQFCKKSAKKLIHKHLKKNHFFQSREWPYKNVKPQIIAEELLVDSEKRDLLDYKFYCFNGEPKVMYISLGRQGSRVQFYYYDMDFNLLDIQRPHHEHDDVQLEKPKNWKLMIELARKLSADFPHIRVDFYNIRGKIKVGELTFYQGGGLMPFKPEEWDLKLGSYIDLPDKKGNK